MATFGQRFEEERKRNGLTQEKLADMFNATKGSISKYENNKQIPEVPALQKYADFFGVSIDYLLGKTDIRSTETTIPKDIEPAGQMVKVPVLGYIRAGLPIFADEHVLDYEEVPTNEVRNTDEYFFLHVKGDSMIDAGILPDSRVLVRRQEYLDNGQIGVILVDGENATVKRIKNAGDKVILYAANKNYEPQIYNAADVRIFGKVIKAEIRFE